jgi:4,5-dihydroxyphthalate decarboxylase
MAITCTLIPSAFSEPIVAGTVGAEGVDLTIGTGNVDDNTRGMIAGKFDIAEMSIGTYVQVKARGADLVALPYFPARRFLQPCVYFARDAAIAVPADLRGKRILVPQYWMTSSVWHRGMLEHEFGIPPTAVTWLTTNDERVEADLPSGVRVTQIMNRPLPEFFTLCEGLILDGTADVVLAPKSLGARAGLRQLFADPPAVALAYLERTGIYPLMHTLVARGTLVRERPELAEALLDLFERSKAHAYAQPGKHEIELPLAGLTLDETRTRLGGDPFPFGVERNARAIDAFLSYALEQGLASARLGVAEAFADPSTAHRSAH